MSLSWVIWVIFVIFRKRCFFCLVSTGKNIYLHRLFIFSRIGKYCWRGKKRVGGMPVKFNKLRHSYWWGNYKCFNCLWITDITDINVTGIFCNGYLLIRSKERRRARKSRNTVYVRLRDLPVRHIHDHFVGFSQCLPSWRTGEQLAAKTVFSINNISRFSTFSLPVIFY